MNARIRICVSTSAHNLEELSKNVVEAEKVGADLIEVRLDHLSSYEGIEKIPELVNIPVIATARRVGDGGRFMGSEENRIRLLEKVSKAGYAYIDVELGSKALAFLSGKNNLIVSWHDFVSTPDVETLEDILNQTVVSGARISKIVTTAVRSIDNITVLRFLARHSKSYKIVCFAMGEEGLPSRVLSPLFGSEFTYASLCSGKETAPGQIPSEELRRIMKELTP
ncbi:MAG: type I 3-dehydroquinate dehydratase [Thermoproteota archaeon]